ncbi:hypothetical protein NON00_08130 [Roseomonas sp. GC11]|nr:hypothetical protein [Roseomonas sp. GC11]MCQ4159895.1 hypothetical protein [Roseomonas sp. GC11]
MTGLSRPGVRIRPVAGAVWRRGMAARYGGAVPPAPLRRAFPGEAPSYD